jgi:hypothetical protein
MQARQPSKRTNSLQKGSGGAGGRASMIAQQNKLRMKVEVKKGQSLMSLAEEALPQILRSKSLSSRIWNEIKRYHRWFGVIYYYSSSFSRVLRVLSLSSNIVIMLFMQSLTYSLTQGDDGSCSTLHNEVSCLSPPSAYGGGKKCYWTPSTGSSSSSSDGDCAFVQPDKSIEVMIFVAIFSALLSTPIALLIDWLIHNILAAPTWDLRKKRIVAPISPSLVGDDVKSKAASSSLYGQSHHNPNKLSIFPSTPSASSSASSSVPAAASLMKRKTRSTTISLFGSRKSKANPNWTKLKYYKVVTAEFEKLKSDLLAYRHTLIKKEHRKELNGKLFLRELLFVLTCFVTVSFFLCLLSVVDLWGLEEHDNQCWIEEETSADGENRILPFSPEVAPSQQVSTSLLTKVKKTLSGFIKKEVLEQQSIPLTIKKELFTIYENYEKENKKISLIRSEKLKVTRLLFLFQKDLMPGILGEILESKD